MRWPYLPTVLALALHAGLCGFAAGSPQCSVVSGGAGAPAIVIDGEPVSPIMFAANNQFGRDEVLIKELELAAKAGIPLFSFDVRLDTEWTPEEAAATVDRFCQAHPSGFYYVRVWLGATPQWMDDHPEECIVKADGTRVRFVSPASAIWRETTGEMLEKRVTEIARGPHGDRFIGVCLANMQTGEWFYRFTDDFMDYSEVNVEAFRRWVQAKYRTTKRLRSAWGDSEVSFKTVGCPSPAQRDQAAWGPFRDPVAHRAAMDFQEFQSEQVAETIAYFAKVVKDATRRCALVGVFYGYTMELSGNGPRALAHSGHLALAKVLDCPDVDMIHAPLSYFERGIGQPGHLHLPADSLALHGKLGVFEEDLFTHLSSEPDPDLVAPGWQDRTTAAEETLAVVRRDFANCFTHRCGMWFFDLLSDGRWNDFAFWESTGLLRRMAAELRSDPVFQPEVAFVVDEQSVHLLRATTHPYLIQMLSWWRSELARIGAPVGYYLQSDLPRLPDSIRVMILANAFQITKQEEAAVDALLDRGGTVVWTYAPGVYGPSGADPDGIGKTSGIAVAPKFDGVPISIVSERTGEHAVIDKAGWQPRFVAVDPDVEVLARYEQTGEPAIAMRRGGKGTVVYTAVPRIPVRLTRWLCEEAGVHLYHDAPCMTGRVGSYLVLHVDQSQDYEMRWPERCGVIERVVPLRRSPVGRDTAAWRDMIPEKTTAVYRCR